MSASELVSRGLAMLANAPPWGVLLVKITAILLAAWVVHHAIGRTNPRWRVLLWRGVAMALIVLPALACLAPALEIRVEPMPSAAEPEAVAASPETPRAAPDFVGPAPASPLGTEIRAWQDFVPPRFNRFAPLDRPIDSRLDRTAFPEPIGIEEGLREPGQARLPVQIALGLSRKLTTG